MRISDWSSDVCSSDLPEVAPTRFYCVPLVYGRFQAGILKKLPQKKLDRLLKIPIVSRLIKNKIKKGMGLQNARYMIVGAAPMPMPLMKWLAKTDVDVLKCYGIARHNILATVNTPGQNLRVRDGPPT